jgi:hypothetical protein
MALPEVTYWVLEGDKPTSWEFSVETSAFSLTIAGGLATFALKTHVSSLDAAERRIREYIHSWEADAVLQTGPVRRRFEMPGVSAPGLGGRATGPTVTATVVYPDGEANARRQYPWRYHKYADLPLIASLIERYQDYRGGRERLTVLGYLCLSALETYFGGRPALALACAIDPVVLSRLGRLVSEVGTYKTARKVTREHELRDLTAAEHYWLETSIRLLIGRAGDVLLHTCFDTELRMADLPPAE